MLERKSLKVSLRRTKVKPERSREMEMVLGRVRSASEVVMFLLS